MNSPTGYDVIYSLLHLSFKEVDYRLRLANEKCPLFFGFYVVRNSTLVRYFYHEYWSSKYVNWFYGSMLLLSPLCESGNDGIPSGSADGSLSKLAFAYLLGSHHSSYTVLFFGVCPPKLFSPYNKVHSLLSFWGRIHVQKASSLIAVH